MRICIPTRHEVSPEKSARRLAQRIASRGAHEGSGEAAGDEVDGDKDTGNILIGDDIDFVIGNIRKSAITGGDVTNVDLGGGTST